MTKGFGCGPTQAKGGLEWAMVLLPGSLLEMKILFEQRISRSHERSAELQIPRVARDDKKERAAVRKERLLRRVLQY
jgi:hypothetical protein